MKKLLCVISTIGGVLGHDASKCREKKMLDDDCCSSKADGSCAPGYNQRWGDKDSCVKGMVSLFLHFCFPEDGYVLDGALAEKHDKSRCPNSKEGSCQDHLDNIKCDDDYIAVIGTRTAEAGSEVYNFICVDPSIDPNFTQAVVNHHDPSKCSEQTCCAPKEEQKCSDGHFVTQTAISCGGGANGEETLYLCTSRIPRYYSKEFTGYIYDGYDAFEDLPADTPLQVLTACLVSILVLSAVGALFFHSTIELVSQAVPPASIEKDQTAEHVEMMRNFGDQDSDMNT